MPLHESGDNSYPGKIRSVGWVLQSLRSGLMECLYRVCSSVSIPSSSCAICPGSARRLASSWSFTAFARAFASWTCFLVRLACWLSNTILPGCTSALLLRVVTVMVGQGNASAMCPSRRLSESSSVTPPSRILRVNLNSSSATRHESCHTKTLRSLRYMKQDVLKTPPELTG